MTKHVDPRVVLREAGLAPKRSFGQSFLVAESVTRAIAEACVPEPELGRARVVEIGAGTGALTSLLVVRARRVTAIERDRDLVPVLARAFEADIEAGKLALLEADAQTVDYPMLLGDEDPASPRVLCGNLPYQITGRLLERAVANADRLERVVVMVQEEVADRLLASPGTKTYGALTVFVRAAFDVARVMTVSRGSFHPPPAVTSAVVRLVPVRPPRARETDTFRALVKGAFTARRKTLRNAWSGVADADRVARAAAEANVSLDARGETLDVTAFARVANALDGAR
jgi:16S rRNA (adenine1518-N6/adenine1519-N6)-dimethyltransferase